MDGTKEGCEHALSFRKREGPPKVIQRSSGPLFPPQAQNAWVRAGSKAAFTSVSQDGTPTQQSCVGRAFAESQVDGILLSRRGRATPWSCGSYVTTLVDVKGRVPNQRGLF